MNIYSLVMAVAVASVAVPAASANAAAAHPDAAAARPGLFTKAQAARGKALYFENCVACHGNNLEGGEDSPPLAGTSFMSHWGKMSVGSLYNFINSQMPMGAPGSLGAAGGADVVAYILSVNNLAAGDAELPADAKVLNGIIINK